MEWKRAFIDGMESISLTDGMIRMEFYNVLVNKKNDQSQGQPNKHEICGELVMTPQAFVKVFSTMENLVQKLEEAGIMKRNQESQNSDGDSTQFEFSPNFQ